MKMKIDKVLIISTVVCFLPMILSLMLYEQLPDQIAVHWDTAGNPDNYASKAFAAFGLPIMMAAINVITHLGLNSDPKQANSSVVLKQLGKWAVPVLTIFLMPVTLFIAMGYNITIHVVAPAFVGVVIIICGNYLPKCKQNYTVGIKLPWTLNNEENWNKTHHLAGYVWIIGGICLVLGTFLNFYKLPILLVILAALVGIPTVYSYLLYKKGL